MTKRKSSHPSINDSAGKCDWEANMVGKHGRGKPCHYYETAWQTGAIVSWQWHPQGVPCAMAFPVSFANKVIYVYVGIYGMFGTHYSSLPHYITAEHIRTLEIGELLERLLGVFRAYRHHWPVVVLTLAILQRGREIASYASTS